MLRYSIRMPLGLFFGVRPLLLAVLAVIFAGKASPRCRKPAGSSHAFPFVPRSDARDLPHVQALGAQVVVTSVIVAALLVGEPHLEMISS